MNMNTINLLILMAKDQNLPPAPPVGASYWVDSDQPLPDKMITSSGDYMIFNPGT